jgi:hypothetical protein
MFIFDLVSDTFDHCWFDLIPAIKDAHIRCNTWYCHVKSPLQCTLTKHARVPMFDAKGWADLGVWVTAGWKDGLWRRQLVD